MNFHIYILPGSVFGFGMMNENLKLDIGTTISNMVFESCTDQFSTLGSENKIKRIAIFLLLN